MESTQTNAFGLRSHREPRSHVIFLIPTAKVISFLSKDLQSNPSERETVMLCWIEANQGLKSMSRMHSKTNVRSSIEEWMWKRRFTCVSRSIEQLRRLIHPFVVNEIRTLQSHSHRQQHCRSPDDLEEGPRTDSKKRWSGIPFSGSLHT